MRELTPQEIANAPVWATSAFENTKGYLFWFNEKLGTALIVGNDKYHAPIYLSKTHYAYSAAQPFPRKEFDISGYEFSDGDINTHNAIGDRYELYVASECIELNKQDAIALAKHFKLTSGDLK